MTKRRLDLGRQGEKLALKKLQNNGYQILAKNFHSRFGEIDIIALDGETLVFIEVKTRTGDKYGKAKEAITKAKIAKIKKTASYYLLNRPNYENFRIDCVTVDIDPTSLQMAIEVFKNIC